MDVTSDVSDTVICSLSADNKLETTFIAKLILINYHYDENLHHYLLRLNTNPSIQEQPSLRSDRSQMCNDLMH